MAWTTPKTNWATGELVTAEDMNAVGENLAALDNQRSAVAVYTTTEDIVLPMGVNFVDIDSDNLNLTITTSGGDVMIHFQGLLNYGDKRIDVEVDGNRISDSEYGIWTSHFDDRFVCFTHLVQGLSAGSHTFKLQQKAGAGNRTLKAGAQFWVREI